LTIIVIFTFAGTATVYTLKRCRKIKLVAQRDIKVYEKNACGFNYGAGKVENTQAL